MKIMIIIMLLLPLLSYGQIDDTLRMENIVTGDLQFATEQYKLFMNNIPRGEMPQTYDDISGKVLTSKNTAWTVGFYPGTLWYLYQYSNDIDLKKEAKKRMKIIEDDKNFTGTHDLGFMMFDSYGNGYRMTRNPRYKKILLNSAQTLSKRFNDTVGCIKSWDKGTGIFPVIIDNMMNLELLCWAYKASGNLKYSNIAKSHADITMKNHFRPDYSSYHVVRYDPSTGTIVEKKTAQGFSNSSSWARGQSWALYGYVMMFRETMDSAYLKQAQCIAHFILTNPNLPRNKIPYWDYDDPKIPNTYRDVSAAAIMASALLELCLYTPQKENAAKYKNTAEQILISLSKPPFRCKLGEEGGFLLKHSVGNLPRNSEVDVPLTYADYYFVEALLRYKNWFLDKNSPKMKKLKNEVCNTRNTHYITVSQ